MTKIHVSEEPMEDEDALETATRPVLNGDKRESRSPEPTDDEQPATESQVETNKTHRHKRKNRRRKLIYNSAALELRHRGISVKNKLLAGMTTADVMNADAHLKITIDQVQAMLIACVAPNAMLSRQPNWCVVHRCDKAKRVCAFVLDSDTDLCFDADELVMFQEVVRFQTEPKWVDMLKRVALSGSEMKRRGTSSEQIDGRSVQASPEQLAAEARGDRLHRSRLLASATQLQHEHFPLPTKDSNPHFVCTKEQYTPVSNESPLFGLDCEMCRIRGNEVQLARITLVDEQEQVLLDELVKPQEPVLDYNTNYSGITAEILAKATMSLQDIQRKLIQLLPSDAILVGHSLENDLKALKMIHPYVIDTSLIYNLSGSRTMKSSLKVLADRFVGMSIQNGPSGHNPHEDAVAALRLVKKKLDKCLQYGDNVISEYKYSQVRRDEYTEQLQSYLMNRNIKFDVLYDVVRDDADKFMAVYTDANQMKAAAVKCMAATKVICVIIANGLCYIHI